MLKTLNRKHDGSNDLPAKSVQSKKASSTSIHSHLYLPYILHTFTFIVLYSEVKINK
jgi:hypothetical protein